MKKRGIIFVTGLVLVGLISGCSSNRATETTATETQVIEQAQKETVSTEDQTVEPVTDAETGTETGTDAEADTDTATDAETAGDSAAAADGEASGNALIAYFTFPETDGTDATSSASRVTVDGEVKGSTQVIAEMIQQSAGGDLFAIETVQEYPGNHEPLIDQAAEEQDAGARPELATQIENLDNYDTIYIGYPNWWGDLPMPLYTFLEEYDFAGKTVIPFTTHGGSSFSNTISTISELQPDANVIQEGFTISRDADIAGAAEEVQSWLQQIGE